MSIEETAQKYLEIWNQRDPSIRRASIDALFTADCSYTDPMASVTGREGVDAFIAAVQAQFAGVAFRLAGNVDEHHDVARFRWHADAVNGTGSPEPLAIGFDVLVMGEGKIRQIVGFLDKAPKGSA